MAIKVVTDSTCDLPQEVAEQWGITVVPCTVVFDDQVYKDGIDMGPDEFYGRLVSSPRLPTTAQPSVNDFLEVYKPLYDEGHQVVSIHVSAKLSGTLNSAMQARESLQSAGGPGSIETIDSQLASAALGLLALEAARMVKNGSSYDQVVTGVQSLLPNTYAYFLVDTLEYLQKGGRIGKASAFLGSLLSVKPILMCRDGQAAPVERPRTRQKGLERMVELVRSRAPASSLAIVHSTTPDEAEALKERFSDLVPEEEIVMARFGPVLGTYLGPGALGLGIVCPR